MTPLVKLGESRPASYGPAEPVKTLPSLGGGPKNLPPVWSSSGVREKPDVCKLCPFRTRGSGFVPDWYPDADGVAPKIGFLLATPTSDEVVEQRPWAGRSGHVWEKLYLKPFGLSLSDTFVGHIIRCQPKDRRFGRPQYPTASLKRGAELTCRSHDNTCWGGKNLRKGGIVSFDPTLFVITFAPEEALQVPAYSRLIAHDIGRAVEKAGEGYRPLVLMGKEVKELVAPWLDGAVKTWRGTFWRGSWAWKEGSALIEPGFIEV